MSLPVDLLEESFDLVAPRGEELADAIYRRLFELAPEAEQREEEEDEPKKGEEDVGDYPVQRKTCRAEREISCGDGRYGGNEDADFVDGYQPKGRAAEGLQPERPVLFEGL